MTRERPKNRQNKTKHTMYLCMITETMKKTKTESRAHENPLSA
jgi:hypothetical protein